MSKTFTEIKKSLPSNIFLETQFKDFVGLVTANDFYTYQNEETTLRSQAYTGYEKWAEPVACLSRLMSNYSSSKKLREIIDEVNLSTKDLHDLYLCYMACHRWILLSNGKSTAKDKVLKLQEVLLDCLKDRSDCSIVCLDSLNSKTIKDIVLYMGNMETKSTLPLDEKAAPSDFVFWKMADLLLKEEFQLIKNDLNEGTITRYTNYILEVKEILTAEQNAYGIKDFTPLYLLRDQNYETYGKLLVKNKNLTNKFIQNWILSSTKQNRDKGGECMFQDAGYSFLDESGRYYAYTHLVELSLEYKNYEALGQLLLLKSTAYIPSTLKEISMPTEILNCIPWEDCMKRIGYAFSESNRAFHLNLNEFKGLIHSQVFPYFLSLNIKNDKGNIATPTDNKKYSSYAGVNLGFGRLSSYCLWFLRLVNESSPSNPSTASLNDELKFFKTVIKHTLSDDEKGVFVEGLKEFYINSTNNIKSKENSLFVEVLINSMINNAIASKTLNKLKDFVFSQEQDIQFPFMSKETWLEMSTRFLTKKFFEDPENSSSEPSLKKRRKVLTP